MDGEQRIIRTDVPKTYLVKTLDRGRLSGYKWCGVKELKDLSNTVELICPLCAIVAEHIATYSCGCCSICCCISCVAVLPSYNYLIIVCLNCVEENDYKII